MPCETWALGHSAHAAPSGSVQVTEDRSDQPPTHSGTPVPPEPRGPGADQPEPEPTPAPEPAPEPPAERVEDDAQLDTSPAPDPGG